MELTITTDCINCARCERECPVNAIYLGDDYFEINPTQCVECEGYHKEPQCALVCPKNCCIKL